MAWLLVIIAATLCFLSLWIVVPAPTMALLPLGVGVPELSPLLLAGAVVVAVLAWRGGGPLHYTALALCLPALLLLALPLAHYPRGVPLSLSQLTLGLTAGDVRVIPSVPMAAPGGVPLTVDVYRPMSPGPHPTVVQVYGGAWQRGAPGNDPTFATRLAAAGYVVFAIDYRHAPSWKWPAQLDDVRAAVAWVRMHASEYGADGSRLALFGRSAGGQLALMAGLPDPGVSAVVSFYGPVDLTQGWRTPPRPDPIDSRGVLETLLGGTPDQMPERYRSASPIGFVSPTAPRTLLVYGSRDHVVEARYGRQLHEALRAAGASSELVEIPWAEHAFDLIPGGLGGQVSLFHVERFLADVFK